MVRLDSAASVPLACALYGSGNLIVTDYTPGKVLRIDSQSLRPGSLSVAIVNRQTGDIIAESQTDIEAPQPQVTIRGEARQHNEPMELAIDIAEADGTPVYGTFSLSVTDYDVVKPDSVLPTISESLMQQPDGYSLADMLSGTYPRIDYGFQTSQTISGQIRGTLFKRIKRPKLMLVRPDTGLRETFELGDSSRFTINGLDFPDGTTYVLEGLRKTGSTSLVQLDIAPLTFPTMHAPFTSYVTPLPIPDGFVRQAQEQVMYGSVDRVIDLPEVVKEKKRQHKPTNLLGMPPFRAFYDDDPSAKTRPDHRTTLYWNPKVKTDAEGKATVRFYASDLSKRYLVTLEGVSDDGMIVQKQTIIE